MIHIALQRRSHRRPDLRRSRKGQNDRGSDDDAACLLLLLVILSLFSLSLVVGSDMIPTENIV